MQFDSTEVELNGHDASYFKNLLNRIFSNDSDFKEKFDCILQFQDNIEGIFSHYAQPLHTQIIEGFTHLLEITKPSFDLDSWENKIRTHSLQVLHNFSNRSAFGPYAKDFVLQLMRLIRTDNDEVSILALKIMMDLLKGFKQILEPCAQPLLDMLTEILQNVATKHGKFQTSESKPLSTELLLNPNQPPFSNNPPHTVSNVDTTLKTLQIGICSYKVVAECPVISVLLFQSYPALVPHNIQRLVSLALRLLCIPYTEYRNHDTTGIVTTESGPSTESSNNSTGKHLLLAQVKLLSFLAYVVRSYPGIILQREIIPEAVIKLFKNCGPDQCVLRKELLVATRHLISTDLHLLFVSKIDALLDVKLLLGESVASYGLLRPLAYSLMADLFHHLREHLTKRQVFDIVKIFSRNLRDSSISYGIQTMSARLILNMIDRIIGFPEISEATSLLLTIFNSFALKFAEMNLALENSLLDENKQANDESLFKLLNPVNMENKKPQVKEGTFLFRNLTLGLKTVMYGLRACESKRIENFDDISLVLNRPTLLVEVGVFRRLLIEVSKGFAFFNPSVMSYVPKNVEGECLPEQIGPLTTPKTKDEKECYEAFAAVLIQLEPSVFIEMFEAELPTFIDLMEQNLTLFHIPQFLLSNESTSSRFLSILLRYLVDRIGELGLTNTRRTAIILRLFRLVFVTVSLFAHKNETVLRPYVSEIIVKCMRLAPDSNNPLNYYLLLRALFRGIGGGRFETLYKEVLPLLHALLEAFTTLLFSARNAREHDLFTELCLTVPVRLSLLLPYMSYLIKPLSYALKGTPELVNLGLRTFELCLDNLTPEFLDPILAPVIDELMDALYTHLQPFSPVRHHSHTAVKILGKLGGRNRKYLKYSKELPEQENIVKNTAIMVHLKGSEYPQFIGFMSLVKPLSETLSSPSSSDEQKTNAFSFFKALTNMLFSEIEMPDNIAAQLTHASNVLVQKDFKFRRPFSNHPTRFNNCEVSGSLATERIEDVFSRIIKALFAATMSESLKTEALEILKTIYRLGVYLNILQAAQACTLNSINSESKCFNILDPYLLVHCLVESLCHNTAVIYPSVKDIFFCIDDAASSIFEKKEDATRLPITAILFSELRHKCYDILWYRKYAGCCGLSILIEKEDVSIEWLYDRQIELLTSLYYVLKDTTSEIPSVCKHKVNEVLEHLIKRIYSDKTKFELNSAFVAHLVMELSNYNSVVRNASQNLLSLLAQLRSTTVTDLIFPFRERLLAPIFAKPLRALPFHTQIGYIDAVRYCLSLENSFITFTEELKRLIHEALALTDADDGALIGVNKTTQFKNAALLVRLRVVCIGLLSAVIPLLHLDNQQHVQLKNRFTAVFFKSLYCKSTEVVDMAYKGLKIILEQDPKLPKEILQNGLRPILMNISDTKRLMVAGLEGLERLLTLLNNYFKVEIGRKLLEHLKVLSSPSALRVYSNMPLEDHTQMRMIKTLINIFHLLPSEANQFLEELVMCVLDLQLHLNRTNDDFFGEPILRFLSRFPSESWSFFASRIDDTSSCTLFINLLNLPNGEVLRQLAKERWSAVEFYLVPDTQAFNPSRYAFALGIANALLKYSPEFFKDKSLFMEQLVSVVRDIQNLLCNEQSSKAYARWSSILNSCASFLNKVFIPNTENFAFGLRVYYLLKRSESVLSPSILWDVKLKLQKMIKSVSSAEESHSLLSLLTGTTSEYSMLSVFLSECLLPALKQLNSSKVLSPEEFTTVWVNQIRDLSFHFSSVETSLPQNSFACLAEIQFLTFLFKDCSGFLSEDETQTMSSVWKLLQSDDVLVKQFSFYALSQFILRYNTPESVIKMVLNELLKTSVIEVRGLVRTSLSIILPKIVKDNPDSSQWLKLPMKILIHGSHSISQMINMYQFLSMHPSEFYSERNIYAPLIINSLQRFGIVPNPSYETKLLSLNLIKLLISWDNLNFVESNESFLTSSMLETIVNYLLKLLGSSPESYNEHLCDIALGQLKLIKKEQWMQVNVKLSIFTRVLTQLSITIQTGPTVMCCLKALLLIVTNSEDNWVLDNITEIHLLIENSIKSDVRVLKEPLCALLDFLLQKGVQKPDLREQNSAYQAFWTKIRVWSEASLNAGSCSKVALQCLRNFIGVNRDSSSSLIVAFMKSFQKLFRIYFTQLVQPTMLESEKSALLSGLKESVTFGCEFLDVFGDQRRWFLSALIQFIEKSPSLLLCSTIFEFTKQWILSNSPVPTTKEKTALVLKMVTWENRFTEESKPTMYEQYLHLLLKVKRNKSPENEELRFRLESAFLHGTQCSNSELKSSFLHLLTENLPESFKTRLEYVLEEQNWEAISRSFWLSQVNLIWGECLMQEDPACFCRSLPFVPKFPMLVENSQSNVESETNTVFMDMVNSLKTKIGQSQKPAISSLLSPVLKIQQTNVSVSAILFIELFNAFWCSLADEDNLYFTGLLIRLLSKEYHIRQLGVNQSVIKTILNAVFLAERDILLPPHLLSYMGLTYGLQNIAILMLEKGLANVFDDLEKAEAEAYERQCFSALSELYLSLSETDLYFGVWKRRCQLLETNVAISFEQHLEWEKAQMLYEKAQIKAKVAAIPFAEEENNYWEDHWISCTQRLNQWDVLLDYSKQADCSNLFLESAWRMLDWNSERDDVNRISKSLASTPTLRKYSIEALLSLNRQKASTDNLREFTKVLEEFMHYSLIRWQQLPKHVSYSHVPLLHCFQQAVEFNEASTIYAQLYSTTAQNLETKVQDIKLIFQAWRERLPNVTDDILIWSDLIAWRQTVFAAINKVYLPLVSATQQNTGNNSSNPVSFLYRGYHEMAWIINRFAHVARRQHLPDLCISQLTKIYTLPNIEIQEAFLKLREQAECHYENNEVELGLEVIINTNLMYFGSQQKSEFFTLKGVLQARVNDNDEANQAFATAIQIDMTSKRAWYEWGLFYDRLYSQNPSQLNLAGNALGCYLQAASLSQNLEARTVVSRILWLISLDTATNTLASILSSSKSEIPVWNWITFIPQLLIAVSRREHSYARGILIEIAKAYPQALHFQLRTAHEEYQCLKKQIEQKSEDLKKAAEFTGNRNTSSENRSEILASSAGSTPTLSPMLETNFTQPWDIVFDVMATLKTNYPLLALTMETMVDQIQTRLKCSAEEDLYRLIVALLNDALQYVSRLGAVSKNTPLLPITQTSIKRLAENILPEPLKRSFTEDFILKPMTLVSYIRTLKQWRNNLEAILDRRPKYLHLEHCSVYLSEFQHQRFDEIEIPGQYLMQGKNANDFVRLERFMPEVDLIRGHNMCTKRLSMRGYDGIVYHFILQCPSTRHGRREERVIQLLKMLDGLASSSTETARRNIKFTHPNIVPLSSHVRIMSDDKSFISLQRLGDLHLAKLGYPADRAINMCYEKLQRGLIQLKRSLPKDISSIAEKKRLKQCIIAFRVEILQAIQQSTNLDSAVKSYFTDLYQDYDDFWVFRRTFTVQYAYITFLTYFLSLNNRFPHKLNVASQSGRLQFTELLPSMASSQPVFHTNDPVRFRLTPALQQFIGDIGLEGMFTDTMLSLARSLSRDNANDLKQYLSLFIRDELSWWFTQHHRPLLEGLQLFEKVTQNTDLLSRRILSLTHPVPENVPLHQACIDLFSDSTKPENLAQMDPLWQAWL